MRTEAPPILAGAPHRLPVLLGLGTTVTLAWVYLLYLGWGMDHMEAGVEMMLMPHMADWRALDLLLVFLMWVVMMAAMMLPSSLPIVLAFRSEPARPPADLYPLRTTAFVAGYLMVWAGFSLIMTLLQWALLEAGWVSPMMQSRSPLFGGLLLLGAGLYQFTPLKTACLSACRSPLSFIMTEWRPGLRGAWVMGMRHGLFCTGCCWMLMALLFLLGVMNIAWIAVLTVFVLLEKVGPGSRWISALTGAALIAWGAVLLHRSVVTMT